MHTTRSLTALVTFIFILASMGWAVGPKPSKGSPGSPPVGRASATGTRSGGTPRARSRLMEEPNAAHASHKKRWLWIAVAAVAVVVVTVVAAHHSSGCQNCAFETCQNGTCSP